MQRRKSALALFLAAVLMTGPSTALARKQPDLDTWITRDVTPFVTAQLTTHPRFKGEFVRFVVFEDGNPAPKSNALAVSLRNQIADAVTDVPGVRVGWSAANGDVIPDQAALDCSKNAVHYYIGLEITDAGNGRVSVDLRAVDLEERSWVPGFARNWQGALSRAERRAYRQIAADRSFRGQRELPFSTAQPDLLAAYLARDLGCALMRQVSGEYLATIDKNATPGNPLNGVAELVSNNLTGNQSLQLITDADRANAILRGKAHHVDADLYQYWITVAPTDPYSELQPVSASAYVHLTGLHIAKNVQPTKSKLPGKLNHSPMSRSAADVLDSIRIVELRSSRACSTGSVSFQRQIERGSRLEDWLDDCFAMQVKTKEDAVVFFLNHQLNNGLVRLAGRDCSQRTEARIARADETLDYALPLASLTHDASSPTSGWPLNPDADIYYAIAVSNSKAARALSRQLDRLPHRCTISVRPGLEGRHLEDWLAEFSATVDAWQPHVDWQAVRVRNVF